MAEIIRTAAVGVDGVCVTPLRVIGDERGCVLHMMRIDSPGFAGFGEVYFSMVRAGVVKAWKRHRLMVQNLAVPIGAVRLVIWDDRPGSASQGAVQEIITGVGHEHYDLVRIPPMVWYGFKGLGLSDALIANCASLPHDPNEVDRLPEQVAAIPYSWEVA